MARITPVQTVLIFNQQSTKDGSYYPCCVYANDLFIEKFEQSLIVAKTVIEDEVLENVLTGISAYREWKNERREDLPTEIKEHFALLPSQNCTLSMPFSPLNNLPTDVMFFSHEEVVAVTQALQAATSTLEKENDQERDLIVRQIAESFSDFLTAWNQNKESTGSYFGQERATL